MILSMTKTRALVSFAIITGSRGVCSYSQPGSHNFIFYADSAKEKLTKTLRTEGVIITPHSEFIGPGHLRLPMGSGGKVLSTISFVTDSKRKGAKETTVFVCPITLIIAARVEEKVKGEGNAAILQRDMTKVECTNRHYMQFRLTSMTIIEKLLACYISILHICIFNPQYLDKMIPKPVVTATTFLAKKYDPKINYSKAPGQACVLYDQ